MYAYYIETSYNFYSETQNTYNAIIDLKNKHVNIEGELLLNAYSAKNIYFIRDSNPTSISSISLFAVQDLCSDTRQLIIYFFFIVLLKSFRKSQTKIVFYAFIDFVIKGGL